jgi:hypothetical protein
VKKTLKNKSDISLNSLIIKNKIKLQNNNIKIEILTNDNFDYEELKDLKINQTILCVATKYFYSNEIEFNEGDYLLEYYVIDQNYSMISHLEESLRKNLLCKVPNTHFKYKI